MAEIVHSNTESSNKCIIVTGGSRGIGAALVKKLAKKKYSVCINCFSNEDRGRAVADEFMSFGGKAEVFVGDVSDIKVVAELFEFSESRLGPIHGLVNSAGITGPCCHVENLNPDDFSRVFDVNVKGTFLCAREAVRRFKKRENPLEDGVIVNISSVVSRLGSPCEWVHYAASKGAINSFTIGLAREVAPHKIRVSAVAPGFIDTEIHNAHFDINRVKNAADKIPARRVGEAEEVADSILWLLSDKASYTHGSIIEIAGGR